MSRTRTIPDATIHAIICKMIVEGGEKAASFASVARACGLSGPTLVQRYASRESMVAAALGGLWDQAEQALTKAEGEAEMSPKGAAALLKALGDPPDPALLALSLRIPAQRGKAADWRARVELALATRCGGGAKGAEAGAILFAAWYGQGAWLAAGGKGFRLKDAIKR